MTARNGVASRGFLLHQCVIACKAVRRDLAGTGHTSTPAYDELVAEGFDPLPACTECGRETVHGTGRCLQHVEPVVREVVA